MNIKLIPYTEIDGIKTFKDSEIMGLYDRMDKEGVAEVTFSDGSVINRSEFLDMAKNVGFFTVSTDVETVGFVWVTDIYMRKAQVHFCFFRSHKEWAKKGVEIGKKTASSLINLKDGNGYVFDVLLGITPKSNVPAVLWLHRIGLKKLCEIPNGVFSAKENRSVPAILWSLTRENNNGR